MAGIEKAKGAPWNRVITSLSMRMTGRSTGRRHAAAFPTADALLAATESQLANVEGFGSGSFPSPRADLQGRFAGDLGVFAAELAAGDDVGEKEIATPRA